MWLRVVAAASARLLCETYASDALEFCPNLAIALSSGQAADQVQTLRNQLESPYRENYRRLHAALDEWVAREAELLVMDPGSALTHYRSFVATFPRYPSGNRGGWNPREFVEQARRTPERGPYGLVAAYFANAYFGVRQSIELDSIRYAIDAVPVDAETRRKLLGVLTITASRMASNYGGHFAQPRYLDPSSITKVNLGRLLDLRARSVWHEYFARLEVVGAESGDWSRPVRPLPGPWDQAIAAFEKISRKGDVVYVDPPYSREEASRYYHLLETLTRYNYPGSEGKALAPPKGRDRFVSEFFTRSRSKFARELCDVLTRAMASRRVVLWSYSDNARCSIEEILEKLDLGDRRVNAFVTKHLHRGQGRGEHRMVQEYIVAISPLGVEGENGDLARAMSGSR